MRKFVIKNRNKRKYTKKTQPISSFSLSKTLYGLMPVLIMIVAFMATLIISSPLHDSSSHFEFTLQMPKISLSNILSYFQSLQFNITQLSITIGQSFLSILLEINLILKTLATIIIHLLPMLYPHPIIVINGSGLIMFENTIFNIVTINNQILTLIARALVQSFSFFAAIVQNAYLSFISLILQLIHLTVQTLTGVTLAISQIVISITTAYIQMISFVCVVILHLILSLIIALTTTIKNITEAIIHVIEIPFKTLLAYGIEIKPYVIILGQHVQMTGSDFTNSFASWGKIASLMNSSK